MSLATHMTEEFSVERIDHDRINPHEVMAGFVALAVIVAGEVLLILGAHHHDVPLSPLAQLVARVFGA